MKILYFSLQFIFFFLRHTISQENDKTILDYRKKIFPYNSINQTLVEVQLKFDNNTRILGYVDFKNTKEDKAYF